MENTTLDSARLTWISQHEHSPTSRIPYLPQLDDFVVFIPSLYKDFLAHTADDDNFKPFHADLPSNVPRDNLLYIVTAVGENGNTLRVNLRSTGLTNYASFDICYHPFHPLPEFLLLATRVRSSLASLHKLLSLPKKKRPFVSVWYATEGLNDPTLGVSWPAEILSWRGEGLALYAIDTVVVQFTSGETAELSAWEIDFPKDVLVAAPTPEKSNMTVALESPAVAGLTDMSLILATLSRSTQRFCFDLLDAAAFAALVKSRLNSGWYRSSRTMLTEAYLVLTATNRVEQMEGVGVVETKAIAPDAPPAAESSSQIL